ncbi:hypothetical protein D3C81_1656920 [compost metagenome]
MLAVLAISLAQALHHRLNAQVQHGQGDRAVSGQRHGRLTRSMQEVVHAAGHRHPPGGALRAYRANERLAVAQAPEQVAHECRQESGRLGWPGHDARQAQRDAIQLASTGKVLQQQFTNELLGAVAQLGEQRRRLIHGALRQRAINGDGAGKNHACGVFL